MIVTINMYDLGVSTYKNLQDYKCKVIEHVLNGISADNFIVNEVYESKWDERMNMVKTPLDLHEFHCSLYDLV